MNAEERKIYHKKWYSNPENAAKKKANAKYHRQGKRERNKAYVDEWKAKHPCVCCGEKEIVCLEFHHLNNKEDCVSILVRKMVSIQRLQLEIDKCVVICRNCHAKVHAGLCTITRAIGAVEAQ